MKTIKKIGAQGDVLFMQVSVLPPTAVLVQQQTEVVVAHSETGHNHTMESTVGRGIELFMDPSNPLLGWVKISTDTEVVHHRPWDTHETLRLLADPSRGETIWEIRRQRERAPEGWRRVED